MTLVNIRLVFYFLLCFAVDIYGNVQVFQTGKRSSGQCIRKGLRISVLTGLYGYMDKSGNIVIEPMYDDACHSKKYLRGKTYD